MSNDFRMSSSNLGTCCLFLLLVLHQQWSVTASYGSITDDYVDSQQDKGPQIEVRAVFINCEADESESLDSEMSRFLRQELLKHNVLRDCNKKLVLTVKFASEPDYSPGDDFIPIDHVFEGSDRRRLRLLNPYILRLRREPPRQAYKLSRIETVFGTLIKSENEKNTGKKNKRGRRPRDTASLSEADEFSRALGSAASVFTLEHGEQGRRSYSMRIGKLHRAPPPHVPTTDTVKLVSKDCGLRLYNTTKASQGFPSTTPADPPYSTQRRPIVVVSELGRTDKIQADYFTVNRNGVCLKNDTPWLRPKRNKQNINKDIWNDMTPLRTPVDHYRLSLDQEREVRSAHKETKIHEVEKSRKNSFQGSKPYWQSNSEERHRSEPLEPTKTMKHNLNKVNSSKTDAADDVKDKNSNIKDRNVPEDDASDFKYELDSTERHFAMYEIGDPNLWHTVHVQLFEKLSTPEGKTVWNDFTKGDLASVNSTNSEWEGEDINVRYRPTEWVPRDEFTLRTTSLCLLEPIRDNIHNTLKEYIVVPTEDVVGVDEATPKKNKRNKNSSDLTTTTNQESHRRVQVRVGRALFGGSGDRFNITTQGFDQFLTLPHQQAYHAQIDLEARADDNQLIRVGASGRITTLVTDNTRTTRTILTMQATNTGLASARFRAMVRDCGPELSGLINDQSNEGTVTVPTLLPPRHTRTLRLVLPFETPVEVAHCSVALVNDNDDSVAVRDAAIKRGDRCFCVWHCDCVCLSDDPKLLCREMPAPQQTAAGLSPRERPRRARFACYPDELAVDIPVVMAGVIIILLLLGFLKALVGVAFRCVAVWGLDRLVCTPRRLDHYHERALRCRRVEYDEEGWPVHPDTKQRTVRLMSKYVEFILNLSFFITMPCVMVFDFIRRLVCCWRATCAKGSTAPNHDIKKCFSSQDIQTPGLQLRRRRRRGLRRWMSPHADQLSTDMVLKGLTPQRSNWCETMQPLLYEDCRSRSKADDAHSCADSEQDDTEYVLMQMQKSRESLARSQKKIDDSGLSSTGNQRKKKPNSTTSQR